MITRFCNNVKAVCKNKKIKISKLEELVGVSRGYFSRQNNMSIETAYKTAKLLECDLTELLEKDMAIEIKKKELDEAIAKLQKEKEQLYD